MNVKTTVAALAAAAIVSGAALQPIAATAQESHRRQQTKNTWRNVAIGSGAVGLYGLLSHNNVAAIAGTAGTLYSLDRYEKDRKSQSHMDHQRAAYYDRASFTHNGHRYVRRTVTRNGKRYYQYVRR